MSSGFNSDVTVGDDVFHVQTENYGQPQCSIVTLVYHRGRILHRRNSAYADLIGAAEYSEGAVGQRVENQHRSVIEEIRRGAIRVPPSPSAGNSAASQGIQVRLRNANSWLASGSATLDVEVLQRADNRPVSGANVEAYLNAAKDKAHFTATTGDDGLARMRFAVPGAASAGAELVIRANRRGGGIVDEIRYVLRAKPKPNPPEDKS
ncbi:MAG TPA: hypothetical protein VGR93_02155 [Candidatus Acidoferrales bacterium]|nr:hypothetical protein [Candidatus Acidoferrales bacterium]